MTPAEIVMDAGGATRVGLDDVKVTVEAAVTVPGRKTVKERGPLPSNTLGSGVTVGWRRKSWVSLSATVMVALCGAAPGRVTVMVAVCGPSILLSFTTVSGSVTVVKPAG